MTTKKSKKAFDCVEFKRQAQERIYTKIQDLSPQEEIAYFQQAVESGPLSAWWKAAHCRSSAQAAKDSDK